MVSTAAVTVDSSPLPPAVVADPDPNFNDFNSLNSRIRSLVGGLFIVS